MTHFDDAPVLILPNTDFSTRLNHFFKHSAYCWKDNKIIFWKYIGYSTKRAIGYVGRRTMEKQYGLGEEEYRKAIKGKKEFILEHRDEMYCPRMVLPATDEGLSKDLFLDGIRERTSTELLHSELGRDVPHTHPDYDKPYHILDLGANLGYYLLQEAMLKPTDRGNVIYAIEPNPDAVEYIKKNLKLNDIKGVEVMNLAISDKVGISPFYVSKNWNCSRFIKGTDTRDIVKTIPMKMETLDHLFKGKQIDFIRMDVEGYEFNILKGAEELIKNNYGMKIYFEFHAQFFNTKAREEFIEWMKKNGLVIKHIFHGEEKTHNVMQKMYRRGYKAFRNCRYTTYYVMLERRDPESIRIPSMTGGDWSTWK